MPFKNKAVFAHTFKVKSPPGEGKNGSAGVQLYAFIAVFHYTPAALDNSLCIAADIHSES